MFPVKLFIDRFFFVSFWEDMEVKGWILGVFGCSKQSSLWVKSRNASRNQGSQVDSQFQTSSIALHPH